MKKNIWFKRKLFGWGWYPYTWQGWLITAVYIAILITAGKSIDETSSAKDGLLMFLIPFALSTIIFIKIAYAKGESPRWQWGRRKKD